MDNSNDAESPEDWKLPVALVIVVGLVAALSVLRGCVETVTPPPTPDTDEGEELIYG